MALFNINLIQNDTDNIKMQLKDGDGVVDLSPFTVTFTMVNDAGEMITIDCIKGYTDYTTTPTTVYAETDGYITLPFTETETSESAIYIGQLHLNGDGFTKGWPLRSYTTVKIWKSITEDVTP